MGVPPPPNFHAVFLENLVKSSLINTVLERNVPLFNNISLITLITSATENSPGSYWNYFPRDGVIGPPFVNNS